MRAVCFFLLYNMNLYYGRTSEQKRRPCRFRGLKKLIFIHQIREASFDCQHAFTGYQYDYAYMFSKAPSDIVWFIVAPFPVRSAIWLFMQHFSYSHVQLG